MNDETSNSDSFNEAYYNPIGAWTQKDGTIMIPAHGSGSHGIWDGFMKIGPDQAHRQFWLWVLRRWRYHTEISAKDFPTLEAEFEKAGRPTVDLITDDAPESDSFNAVSYQLKYATTQTDGTIAIPCFGMSTRQGISVELQASGRLEVTKSMGHWDGILRIRPADADHLFWLWILKRWIYQSDLSSEDIPTLQGEFEKDGA